MKIGNFTNVFQVNNKRNNSNSVNNASYPNLAPLKKDTVSFCAKPLLKKIASMKNNNGYPRFSEKNIVRLMSLVNKKNEPLFDELANLRYSNGSYRLHGADIANFLSMINEDNKPLFKKLIDMKDDKGRYLLRGYDVARIFHEVYKFPEVYKYNIQRCEKLLRNGHPVCDELIYNLRHGCGSCWPC